MKKLCIAILQKKFVNYNSAYKSRELKHFIIPLSFVMVYLEDFDCHHKRFFLRGWGGFSPPKILRSVKTVHCFKKSSALF